MPVLVKRSTECKSSDHCSSPFGTAVLGVETWRDHDAESPQPVYKALLQRHSSSFLLRRSTLQGNGSWAPSPVGRRPHLSSMKRREAANRMKGAGLALPNFRQELKMPPRYLARSGRLFFTNLDSFVCHSTVSKRSSATNCSLSTAFEARLRPATNNLCHIFLLGWNRFLVKTRRPIAMCFLTHPGPGVFISYFRDRQNRKNIASRRNHINSITPRSWRANAPPPFISCTSDCGNDRELHQAHWESLPTPVWSSSTSRAILPAYLLYKGRLPKQTKNTYRADTFQHFS